MTGAVIRGMQDVWSHPFLQGIDRGTLASLPPPFIPSVNGTDDVVISQNFADEDSDDFLDCSNSNFDPKEEKELDAAFGLMGESVPPASW